MRWELGAKYAPPHGSEVEWFGTAIAELRGQVTGPITIRLVFRREADSRLHTIAGAITDALPGCVTVRPDTSEPVTVPYDDLVYFKPLSGAGLPPTVRQA